MRRLLTILSLIATMTVQGAKSTDLLGKHLSINLRQENIPLEQAQQYFGQWLKLDDKTTFLLFKDETDELGYRHQHYRQQHDGTDIESTRLIVHSKDGKLTHVNGYVLQLDAANARLVPRRVSVPGKEVVLVITPEGLFNAVKDFDPATRDIIYTDVATGRIVKREPTTFYLDGQRNIKSETYYLMSWPTACARSSPTMLPASPIPSPANTVIWAKTNPTPPTASSISTRC